MAKKAAAKKKAAKGGARKAAEPAKLGGAGSKRNPVQGGQNTRKASRGMARMALRDGTAKGGKGGLNVGGGSNGKVYTFKTQKNKKTGRVTVAGGDRA